MARSHARTIAIAAMVKRDYAAVAGKVIMLQAVTGYDAKDEPVERSLDPPVAFLVSADVPDSELTRVCDAWVDPTWDVVPQEPKDPQINDLGSFFCYGPSYHLFSEEVEPGDQAPGTPVAPAAPPVATLPPTKKFQVPYVFKTLGALLIDAATPAEALEKADKATTEQFIKYGQCGGTEFGVPEEVA